MVPEIKGGCRLGYSLNCSSFAHSPPLHGTKLSCTVPRGEASYGGGGGYCWSQSKIVYSTVLRRGGGGGRCEDDSSLLLLYLPPLLQEKGPRFWRFKRCTRWLVTVDFTLFRFCSPYHVWLWRLPCSASRSCRGTPWRWAWRPWFTTGSVIPPWLPTT